MSSSASIASTLSSDIRQQIAIDALAKSKPITHLAAEHQVSRKFVYQQGHKAKSSLAEACEPKQPDHQVLFHLPITKNWLFQLILGLVLICHSSLRGVMELLRYLFDVAISLGTVHNRLHAAAEQATVINEAQDLSGIRVDLRDEIFQAGTPVLTVVDAQSTYCYLLQQAEHRDQDTWSLYLLEAQEQGLAPERTIADAASGLRSGHAEVFGASVPCDGDLLHIQYQCQSLVHNLTRQVMGATTRYQQLKEKMRFAKQRG